MGWQFRRYYELRHIPLRLANQAIDRDLATITEEIDVDLPVERLERAKAAWAAVESAAGAKDRVETLARDLLNHFLTRQNALSGKAMAAFLRDYCRENRIACTVKEERLKRIGLRWQFTIGKERP